MHGLGRLGGQTKRERRGAPPLALYLTLTCRTCRDLVAGAAARTLPTLTLPAGTVAAIRDSTQHGIPHGIPPRRPPRPAHRPGRCSAYRDMSGRARARRD